MARPVFAVRQVLAARASLVLLPAVAVPALLAAPAAGQPAPPPPASTVAPAPAYTGVTIRRPTLMVRDMDRALALYRDILGLRVGRLGQDPPDSYVYTAFNIPKGTVVMHATLDTGSEQRVLSLVAVRAMPVPPKREGLRTTGMLVNANGRLNAIRALLTAGGYKQEPCHALPPNGTECAFLDADGHLIALYQYPPR
jgi:catechol 2,3-dioxygenase-like lactoylglutathione lyase family enzyme